MFSYHNKTFKPVQNAANGEVSSESSFQYKQKGNVVSAEYAGGEILSGHLLGLVDPEGCINMHYHHVNNEGKLMAGFCHSKPELLPDGRIRLHEQWQWTTGNQTKGSSILEECA